MHQDKPQDTYEKLLFDELKTLVAEYSVTRKTSSLAPREAIGRSVSRPARRSGGDVFVGAFDRTGADRRHREADAD